MTDVLAGSRPRLAVARMSLWPGRAEPMLIAAASLALAAAAIGMAAQSTPVYLSPDGAHAVTDAWALVGRAPRTFYYLPGWPALLLPLLLAGVPAATAVQGGLAIALSALFTALYALARQFTSPRAAFVGAVTGAFSTSIGELLGWQGGETLVGLVASVAALALLERWVRLGRRRDAAGTGVAYAYVIATHPFTAAVATGLIGLRWLAALLDARRFDVRGWSPLAIPGLLLAAAPPAAVSAALYARYLAIQGPSGSGLRPPDASAVAHQLVWITRESPALLVLTLVLAAAALTTSRGLRAVAVGVIAVFVVLPACLSGDPSYQSRVVYLLPIVLALGAARLWQWVDLPTLGAGGPSASRRLGASAAAVLAAGLVVSLGFAVRLPASTTFYSDLQPADVALLGALSGGGGTIATSWTGNRYWDGMTQSWYAEALSNRAAIGPTDPALSTRAVELADSAAAWQLFSGQQGIEDGAVQMSFGPQGWRADPAIAAFVAGHYVPLIYVNDGVDQYPGLDNATSPLAWRLGPGGLATGLRTSRGPTSSVGRDAPVVATASLTGSTVHLAWSRGAGAPVGDWTIWVWPQYGLPWADVSATPRSAVITPQGGGAVHSPDAWDRSDPRVTVSVAGGATLRYLPSDPRYRLQAIAITVPAGSDLEVTISVSGVPAPGPLVQYDERSLIDAEHVGTVVVSRDTGWADRFRLSPCFDASASDAELETFQTTAACRR